MNENIDQLVEAYYAKLPVQKNKSGGKLKILTKPKLREILLKNPDWSPDKYLEKIIDYPGSPTGKAYIGINKEPLMKNEAGYGFQGVLLQDETRQFIQCSGCGNWLRQLNTKHLEACLQITPDEYKKMYGLNKSQGLVSDAIALKNTENVLKGLESAKESGFVLGRPFTAEESRKGGRTKKRRQRQNEFGTCPEQVKARLYEFIRTNHELPGRMNRGYALYKIIYNRHGTFGRALPQYGLPKFERKGSSYYFTFRDHTIHKMNLNQFSSFEQREELFRLMMEKCPVLTLSS